MTSGDAETSYRKFIHLAELADLPRTRQARWYAVSIYEHGQVKATFAVPANTGLHNVDMFGNGIRVEPKFTGERTP